MAKTKSSKIGKKKTAKRSAKKASTKKKPAKKSTKKKSTKKKSAKKTSKKKSSKKKTSKKKSSKKKTSKKAGSARTKTARKSKVAKRTTKKKTATSKAKAPTRKSRTSSRRKLKTHLKKRELNYFAKLLLLKRAELLGDMDSMHNEALNIDSANLSHMPLHMADIGSDNYEQELTLGLLETERKRLNEINAALERIKDRTYGVCEATGKPIAKARLEAKPWAKYTIEAAREMERKGKM